jgi:tRNA1(Val) A37 N6-methylase TrmN6
MNIRGRYYTNETVSALLVANLKKNSPDNVLELGVGTGSLIKAAYNRWQDANYFATDIDTASILEISNSLSFVKLFKLDGLLIRLPEEMCIRAGTIDVAVCNPPYYNIKKNHSYEKILEESNLIRSKTLSRLTSDIIFLAQNLIMLKDGGELGIILPDNLLTGHEYIEFRFDLINQHNVLGVIQLPDKIFKRTEARTHILLLEKGNKTKPMIPLHLSDLSGEIKETIMVSKDELINRMDYLYYLWKKDTGTIEPSLTLREMNVDIKRGRRSKHFLRKLGVGFFHTSSFPKELSDGIDLISSELRDDIVAESGDILIARVGKRCIGRVTIVKSGKQIISDCVFRIRAPDVFQISIWKELISKRGQDCLRAIAHGVCAQVISKKDLLDFRIPQ